MTFDRSIRFWNWMKQLSWRNVGCLLFWCVIISAVLGCIVMFISEENINKRMLEEELGEYEATWGVNSDTLIKGSFKTNINYFLIVDFGDRDGYVMVTKSEYFYYKVGDTYPLEDGSRVYISER